MRLVQVRIPDAQRDAVLDVLDDEGVDYVLTREEGGTEEATIAQFPLPAQAVEAFLETLYDVGFDDDYVVVLSAETARTRNFEDLEERFVIGAEKDERIAPEEMRSRALEMTPAPRTYYALTFLSAVVAAAGLLLDSPAVVVGSMVIAPQVGSALTASAGMVLNDRDMISDGLRAQALGLSLAIVGAAAFGWVIRSAAFVPAVLDITTMNQISKRISSGLLSLAVAVAAGGAGAVGLATALPVSLVGVMIAAAIIPAAAAVGIGLAWNIPAVAVGAFVLLVVNAVVINLTGMAGLWWLGYRPDLSGAGDAVSALRTLWPTLLAGAVVIAVFAGAGLVMAQQMTVESEVNNQVERVLAQPQYEQLELAEVRTAFAVRGDPEVTVVVKRPVDRAYPVVADEIQRQLSIRVDRQVNVEVQFLERQRARR